MSHRTLDVAGTEALHVYPMNPLRLSWACVLLFACVPPPSNSSDDNTTDMRTIEGRLDRGVGQLLDVPIQTDAADAAAPDGLPPDMGIDPDDGIMPDMGDPPDMAQPDAFVPPAPQCDDGRDNDEDGLFDLSDPDCGSPADPTERGENPQTACSNGADDDEDGIVDWPLDPGCHAAGDDDEQDRAVGAACANGEDDDGDGSIDYPQDPGCQGRGDTDERDPMRIPECANGQDDDGNGATDYPFDNGCDSAADPVEASPCGAEREVVDLNRWLEQNEFYEGDLTDAPATLVGTCGGAAGGEFIFAYRVETQLDRLAFSTIGPETEAPVVMYLRNRCISPTDVLCDRGAGERNGAELVLERPGPGVYFLVVDTGSRNRVGRFRLTVDAVHPPQCRNGIDDDEDGRADAADPGCEEHDDPDEADPLEDPVCLDGLDNDGDGDVDWPADEDCETAGAAREAPLCPLAAEQVRVGQEGGDIALTPGAGPGVSQPGCDVGFGPESVLVLTLSEPSNVTVTATAGGMPLSVAIYAREVCDDRESELGCTAPAQAANGLRLRQLVPGTYFVFIENGVPPPMLPYLAHVEIESLIRECNDERDNDLDGLIDLADWGCEEPFDDDEVDVVMEFPPECADGFDNDEDGEIDWPADPECRGAGDVEATTDPHLSEDFDPDRQNMIWCNGQGVINFREFGPMTFDECDALANRTGTQFYAGIAWQNEPGQGWVGVQDAANGLIANRDWNRLDPVPRNQPQMCRLALMPHRQEPNDRGQEAIHVDATGKRWHYWTLNNQTASQCMAFADDVRGRLVNPWQVGLGALAHMSSPTHWCHAGPVFNAQGQGLNSDRPGTCTIAYWE